MAQLRRKDINLSRLSRDTGYTLAHVSRVFSLTRAPSLRCAKKMAKALKITVDQLIKLIETGRC
jgi:hypothetical protein